MAVTQRATRITVFLSEDDRSGRHALHDELLRRAKATGMAGGTIWRAVEGFGPSGRIRTARFPDAGTGLPVAIELVDSDDRIEAFLSVVHDVAPGSFVTREEVRTIRFASPGGADS